MGDLVMYLRMANPSDEQRVWLRSVLAQTKLSPTALAKKAKVTQPTLTAFLNSKKATHALSATTISKVEKATGLRYGPEPRLTGFRESEAAPYKSGEVPELDFIGAAIDRTNGIDPWTLRSRALETAGYLPGDVLIVDLNRQHMPGDVVCAQLYDWARAKADTVFRLWEPPCLIAATQDPTLRKPFLVDNENVVVRGVVMASIRPRTARVA